jgi:hypothetical protein
LVGWWFSLPRVLNVLFRALRASHFLAVALKSNQKRLAPTLGFHCVKTPLATSPLQGPAKRGHPWPVFAFRGSCRSTPSTTTSLGLRSRGGQITSQIKNRSTAPHPNPLPQAGEGAFICRSQLAGESWKRYSLIVFAGFASKLAPTRSNAIAALRHPSTARPAGQAIGLLIWLLIYPPL